MLMLPRRTLILVSRIHLPWTLQPLRQQRSLDKMCCHGRLNKVRTLKHRDSRYLDFIRFSLSQFLGHNPLPPTASCGSFLASNSRIPTN